MVITAYTVLAMFFNWPLISHFTTWISGNWQYNDAPFFIWNFWWIKKALFSFSNPLITNTVYFPQNVNLTLHTLSLLPSIVSIPFQVIFNPKITYNILYIGTFVLSAFSTYLLTYSLTKNKTASFLAGVIFAFNPYIFARSYAGHFNLLNTWTIPLFAYFLLKNADEKGGKNITLAALILILQSYIDFHYLLFLLIFAGIFFIWQVIVDGNKLLVSKKFIFGFTVWILLFLPILIPTYRFYKDTNYNNWVENNYHPQKAAFENTDLKSYVGFSTFHPIFGKNHLDITKNQTGGLAENNVFLGYTVMVLALLGLLFSKSKLKFFWLVVFTIFFSLSLGNSLQIDGKIYYDMPYGLIKKYFIPSLDIVASRFVIMVYLSLAVLVAYFINYLLKIIKSKNVKYVFVLSISLILIFEYFPTLATDKLETSPIYSKLAQEKGDYNLVVIPEISRISYYQAIHEKKLVGGYTGRRTHEYYLSTYFKIPGLRVLLLNIKADKSDLDRNVVLLNLDKYNVKYIIIDKIAPFATRDYIIGYLENDLKFNIFYQDDLVNVYQVK